MKTLLDFFKKPEVRLAVRISSIVLFLLICVVALAAAGAERANEDRKEEYFRMRESMLLSRPDAIKTLSELPRETISNRLGERRGFSQNARNIGVVFPSGEIETRGGLDGSEEAGEAFRTVPMRHMEVRRIGDEPYLMYAFPANDRTVVLYEVADLLDGPVKETLLSLLFGISLFSILLFFVSLKIAREVIRPIEELAERERAYARHIAHELKTPLAVAKSDLELALASGENTDDHIDSAIEEIDSLRSSVDDLLLLSLSEGDISKESTDVRKAVEAAILKKGDVVTWKILPKKAERIELPANPRLLKAFLRNLTDNVRVHAIPGSTAEIRLSEKELSFENESGEVSEKIRKNAFEAFVGTPGKGSGIGLSLVKRIADLHGWKVTFEADRIEKKVRIRVIFNP